MFEKKTGYTPSFTPAAAPGSTREESNLINRLQLWHVHAFGMELSHWPVLTATYAWHETDGTVVSMDRGPSGLRETNCRQHTCRSPSASCRVWIGVGVACSKQEDHPTPYSFGRRVNKSDERELCRKSSSPRPPRMSPAPTSWEDRQLCPEEARARRSLFFPSTQLRS